MTSTLGRGLVAGAVGTTVITAVTYVDMALRGRSPSTVPAEVVDRLLGAADTEIAGRGRTRDNRRVALGELSGITMGLGTGVVASIARSAGYRPPAPVAAALIGAAAMAGAEGPAAVLHVTDPRSWDAAAWVGDIVPHLAYGVATHATLAAWDRRGAAGLAPKPARVPPLSVRAFAIGVASGGRSCAGLGALSLLTPSRSAQLHVLSSRPASALLSLAAGSELVMDKLPTTPSRLEPPVLAARITTGSVAAGALARREDRSPVVAAVLGGVGAAVGSYAGAAWRRRFATGSRPDWQGALIEDGVVLLLTTYAVRRVSSSSAVDPVVVGPARELMGL